MDLFNLTDNSITLLREITREDFNVIRQESENSICFILDMAEEYWEYKPEGKKTEASYKIRLKGANNILDDKLYSNRNALTASYFITITKVHKLFVVGKNREELEANSSKNEEEFYKKAIKEITEAVKALNNFLMMEV